MASADHARIARITAVPVNLQRAGAAESYTRSDPLQRTALVLELRDGTDDQVRHAGRVDARLRRYVVSGIPGLYGIQSQRNDAHVRDVRKRRREYDAPPHCGSGRGRWWWQGRGRRQSDDARVVPAVAAVPGSRRVDAQHLQL